MIQDFYDFQDGSEITTDLCIIGAGVAGITVAREFLDKNIDVCLLESGGPDYDGRIQALYAGENRGQPYYELDDSRLRFFGGTTLVWGGRCMPHEAIDFETRSWIPHSGWPFSRADLDPWYRRAHDALEIDDPVYDEQAWKRLGIVPPSFDPLTIRTGSWQFDEAFARFDMGNCQDLQKATNIRILLHASVTNIQADPSCSSVQHINIATLAGIKGRVRAKAYVLAAGGIETPRLLLASNGVASSGIGNDNDLVGRFFMEHPHGRAAEVITPDPYKLWDTFRKRRVPGGKLYSPMIRPGERLQEKAGILNTAVTIKCQRRPEIGISAGKAVYKSFKARMHPTRRGRRIWRIYKKTNQLIHALTDRLVRRRQLSSGRGGLYLIIRGEQAPNPDSRVVLSGQHDALGVPQADLDWRFSDLDKRTVTTLVDALHNEFQRLGLGSVIPEEWLADTSPAWPVDPTVSNHPIGGYHHMGTTRMADDPKHGVVDADSCVHGIGNLYVAGSSVFPTSGWANPVLTTMALTLRLADHLKVEFEKVYKTETIQ